MDDVSENAPIFLVSCGISLSWVSPNNNSTVKTWKDYINDLMY